MDFYMLTDMLSTKVMQQIIQEHQKKDKDLKFLLEFKNLKQIWDKTSADEKVVIHFFLLYKGTDFITYRELEQKELLPIPPARFRIAITKLCRKGIIYTLRRLWGELAYVMPSQLVAAFRRIILPLDSTLWAIGKPIPSNTSYHIMDGIFQVLNYVRSHSVELTKKGTLHRRNLRLFLDLVGLNDADFRSLRLFPNRLAPYENHEAILLDLLTSCNLLLQSDQCIELGDIDSWVNKSWNEWQQALREKLPNYLDMNPRLHFVYDLLWDLNYNQTYSLQEMLAAMGEFAPTITEVEEKLFTAMESWGILSMLRDGKDLFFTIRSVDEMPCGAYVQPNFEILLPAFAPMYTKWTIASFSHLVKKEEMWTFIIGKQSVQMFLESGKTAEDLIGLLESLSTMPIPKNLVDTIMRWQREYQRIHFFDARIMEVSDLGLAAEIESSPSLTPHIIQRLGDRFFAIRLDTWEPFIHELEKRGYAPGALKTDSTRDTLGSKRLEVFKKDDSKLEYKVESIFPDFEDALPGLKQIPRMWSSHFQTYHGSTLRELITKAVQVEAELRFEWGGEELSIKPKTLVNKEGYWIMQAYDNKQEYAIDKMGKIQLLLP